MSRDCPCTTAPVKSRLPQGSHPQRRTQPKSSPRCSRSSSTIMASPLTRVIRKSCPDKDKMPNTRNRAPRITHQSQVKHCNSRDSLLQMDMTKITRYDRQAQEGYILADEDIMRQELALANDSVCDLLPIVLPGTSGTTSPTRNSNTNQGPTDWCFPEEWPTDDGSSDECPTGDGPARRFPTVTSTGTGCAIIECPTVQSPTVRPPTAKFSTTPTRSPTDVPEYRPVQQWELCWRCGRSGHMRSTCRRPQILFCSRCGLVGVLSRDCTCGYRSPAYPSRNRRFTIQTNTTKEFVSRGVQCYCHPLVDYAQRPETISRETQCDPPQ